MNCHQNLIYQIITAQIFARRRKDVFELTLNFEIFKID